MGCFAGGWSGYSPKRCSTISRRCGVLFEQINPLPRAKDQTPRCDGNGKLRLREGDGGIDVCRCGID